MTARGNHDDLTGRAESRPADGWTSLCDQLVVLGDDLAGIFERVCRSGDVTLIQFRALQLLDRLAPTAQEPWRLAQVLGIGSNHITMVLDRLEADGHLTRGPHPRDGRRRLVALTPSGAERVRAIAGRIAAVEQQLLADALTATDQRELQRLSAQLRHAIRERVIPEAAVRLGP